MTRSNYNDLIFTVLILLIIIGRFIFFNEFSFKFIGSDEMTYWQGASDYSKGIFHEPFFYGQSYNFMLEAFAAVPLLWCGVPLYMALPIATSFLALFPFIFFAIVLYKRGFTSSAFLFLLIPITLSAEYEIFTSIPRGFINGLFFCSFLIYCILDPLKRSSFIIFGIFSSIAYVVNPSSVIFSLPIAIFLFLHNIKNPRFYIYSILSVIPAFSAKYFAKQFYIDNPDYNVHNMWDLAYDFEVFIDGFNHLDKYFKYFMPIFWSGGWIVILLIFTLGIILIKSNWKSGISIISAIIFILLSMGINKINDDIGSIFLSSTRMFTALPLLLGLAIFWTYPDSYKKVKNINVLILTIALSVWCTKISTYKPVIKDNTKQLTLGSIDLKKYEDFKFECEELYKLIKKHDVDLTIFIYNKALSIPQMEFLNFGCPLILEHPEQTVMNLHDRRTWVYKREETNNARKRVLIYNLHNIHELKDTDPFTLVGNDPNLVLLTNNNKTVRELSEMFEFKYKRNVYQ